MGKSSVALRLGHSLALAPLLPHHLWTGPLRGSLERGDLGVVCGQARVLG